MSNLDLPLGAGEVPGAGTFARYVPELGAAAFAFSRAVYRHSRLSHREFEAGRIRTAQINGCIVCQAWRGERDTAAYLAASGEIDGRSVADNGPAPDEAFYEAVEGWRNSPVFSDRERVVMEFAERMGEAPQELSSDEGFWERARGLFDTAELMDLTLSASSWIAMGRMMHVLGLDRHCGVPAPAAA